MLPSLVDPAEVTSLDVAMAAEAPGSPPEAEGDSPRWITRFFWILALLLLHSLGACLRMLLVLPLHGRAAFRQGYATSLARLAERIGPAAVKMAQIASARPDLLPGWLIEPLARLQAQVASPRRDAIDRQLRALFPGDAASVFSYIRHDPIASGSIAYVLAAQTRFGEQVVLKIVRPDARRMMKRDLAILARLATWASRSRRLGAVPVGELIEQLGTLCLEQCSMLREAANLRRLSGQLAHQIVVPGVFEEWSNDDVLVMSRVEIERSLAAAEVPDRLFRDLALLLLREVFRMVFVHGVVHGDLHPGNVGVSPNGALVLVDFGLVARLREVDRRRFRSLFFGVATGDAKLVSLVLVDSSSQRPADLDTVALDAAVARLLQRRTGQTAGEFLVADFTRELFEIQRQHGLRGAPAFANAIWALAMYEGLARHRFPDLNFQAEAMKVLGMPYTNTATVEHATQQ